ncbi:MAG: zinc ABC transporter substrate-binding protein [Porphyromonas sp.]|nr:zinc ABC transporter substrate-binding protein [Porphyromonas sp.]
MMKHWIGLIAVLLLTTACTKEATNGKPIITVSLLPEKYFVEQMTGDWAEVHVLVPYGNNPEAYDPTPKDIAKLHSSKTYLAIGTLPFEQQWIRSLPDSVTLVNIAERMPHDLIHGDHEEHGHVHQFGDPHYWTSLTGGEAMAEVIREALAELFPDRAEEIRQNYEANLAPTLTEIAEYGQSVLGQRDSLAFVIYHPSLSLFAEEWGLRQLAIEEHGREPSVKHLIALIDEARKWDTRVVFIQREFDTKSVESIASDLRIHRVVIDPLAEDWAAEMRSIISQFE